jgi:hypothetical protein
MFLTLFNRLVCRWKEKNIMANEIQGIGGLNFFLSYLLWTIIKYVIYDETLPNFIKRKHPRKGEKKKQQGPRARVQASKQMCNKVWQVCENFRGPLKMKERDHNFQCSAE